LLKGVCGYFLGLGHFQVNDHSKTIDYIEYSDSLADEDDDDDDDDDDVDTVKSVGVCFEEPFRWHGMAMNE
jgi:hypothetical protein